MRPNFLFIVVDDLNAWIGALNRHPQTKTPNIDALARRGSLFTHAYCSAPYCNASRMGMFSGTLPSTSGVYQNESFWDSPNRPDTFIESLRNAGYYNVGAGKVFHGTFDYASATRMGASVAEWRDVENRAHLWDEFHMLDPEPLPKHRPLNRLFNFGDFDAVPPWYHLFDWGPIPTDAEEILPDVQTASFVEDFLLSTPQEPFFCAAGIYKPHLPWHAPARFFDLHPRDDVVVPTIREDDLDDAPPLARSWALTPPDHALVTSRGVWKDAVQGYLACISYADEMVGRLISALSRSSVGARTTIVLCGDNGFHLGEKLHWRKFALWEEATRVPMIYVEPNGPRNLKIIEPVSLLDLHPTILAAAGAPGDQRDGADLSALMHRPAEGQRDRSAITTWLEGNHSLRTSRWRYTRYSDGGHELFDHAADPNEWNNLAQNPEFASVCARLSATIDARCCKV
ncbi:MAG: iduronate-2-sulfatase [Verrucomicrobiaceae bacterium]|nr:MAG: iduronate-2-sulfatase [Verrucomicrobiaceae bacterium]